MYLGDTQRPTEGESASDVTNSQTLVQYFDISEKSKNAYNFLKFRMREVNFDSPIRLCGVRN
jgi:hypothetical protein